MKIEDVKVGMKVVAKDFIRVFIGKNFGRVDSVDTWNDEVVIEGIVCSPEFLEPYCYKARDKVRVLDNTWYNGENKNAIMNIHNKINMMGWVTKVYPNRIIVADEEGTLWGNTFNFSDIEPWEEIEEDKTKKVKIPDGTENVLRIDNKLNIYSSCGKWHNVELFNGLQFKAILKMIGEKQLILENDNGLYVVEKNEIKLMYPSN